MEVSNIKPLQDGTSTSPKTKIPCMCAQTHKFKNATLIVPH